MKNDESIERLLRSARSGVPAPSGQGSCLDAETLAAWVDGGLAPGQIRQAEIHVSSCARCQAMVAATMTSAPLSEAVAADRPSRSWSFGWMVPAAAGIAAVGLWFMVPSRTPLNKDTPAPAVASTPSTPAAERELAQAPIEQSEFRDRLGRDSGIEKNDAAAPQRRQVPQQTAANEAKLESTIAERADQKTATREEAAAKVAGDLGASKDTRSAPEAMPPPSALAAAAPPPSAPAAGVSVAPAAAPRAAYAVAADRSANAQVAGAEVVSPNPSIRWRTGPGGSILHSVDGGTTWTLQSAGVSVDLLAGASPSPDVCWLVGRAGTVLRTINGGRQWQRLTFVGALELRSISASDASTAEVTTSDGRVFRTADAGISWR